MKNSRVHIVLALLTLVLGGALEELLPKVLCVGFPVLLASVQYFASRRAAPFAIAFALMAGGMEDALSGLSALTSVGAFVLLTVGLRRLVGLPSVALALIYPAYQFWLYMWTPHLAGGIFGRLLLSVPIGALTACVVTWALGLVERGVAIDEVG